MLVPFTNTVLPAAKYVHALYLLDVRRRKKKAKNNKKEV